MTIEFPPLTAKEAPQAALPSIYQAMSAFHFLPNLIGVMAHAPALAESYMALSTIFQEKTQFSDAEQHVVLLTVSRFHGCNYCMAAHSGSAKMKGISDEVVQAIRSDTPISDDRLEALRVLTHELVETRGMPSETAINHFLEQGYSSAQILDILVGIAQKTLSNYTNHLAKTPIDDVLRPFA